VESSDVNPPEISDVSVLMSDPIDTVIGWENISCTVVDDVEVNEVKINITYPDSHTENISMNNIGSTFYYNITLDDVGSYSYFIWVNDTSDNINVSALDVFIIPPNYDINKDGTIDILDLNMIALIFGETIDPAGSIREDVDNNGIIDILDITLVAYYFGEDWI
jgi:hypothetical protein